MFTRLKRQELQNALLRSPAVVLLGPRQVGKTTLALDVALPNGGYLDLESPEDRNKLSNVESQRGFSHLAWTQKHHSGRPQQRILEFLSFETCKHH